MVYLTEDGPVVHLSWDNHTGATSIDAGVLYDAVNRWMLSGKPTQYFAISTTLGNNRDAVSLVMHAVSSGFKLQPIASRSDVDYTILDTFADSEFPDEQQSIVAVHNPIVANATAVHGRAADSLTDAVSRRLHGPPTREPISEAMAAYMVEFVCELFPEPLARLSHEEVASRMNKPSQKRELESMAATYDVTDSRWSVFLKTEPTGPIKPARIIVSSKGPQNYELASFIMPMFDSMQSSPCWCPGAHGAEIQNRVHLLHLKAKLQGFVVEEYDYESFDATTGTYGSGLLRAALRRAFPHDPYQPLLDHMTSAWAGNLVGIKEPIYMGIGTYSGSSDTTFRNTLLNMFVIYVCFRTNNMAGGPSSAFQSLRTCALVSGDDSLTCAPPDAKVSLISVAKLMGMKLGGRTYENGSTTFLGRLYPDPYAGPDNVADITRWLKSYHLVQRVQGFSLEQSMSNKAYGRLINDPNTPLLADYCKAVLREHPITHIDPRFFDDWTYNSLTSGYNYSCTLDDDSLSAAIITYTGMDPTTFSSLRSLFAEVVPKVGTTYSVLTPVFFTARPGSLVNGVPFGGSALPRPPLALDNSLVKQEKAAIATSTRRVNAALRLASSSPPTPVSAASSVSFSSTRNELSGAGLQPEASPDATAQDDEVPAETVEILEAMGFIKPPPVEGAAQHRRRPDKKTRKQARASASGGGAKPPRPSKASRGHKLSAADRRILRGEEE